MNRMSSCIAALFVIACLFASGNLWSGQPVTPDNGQSLVGKWENQLGSTLSIEKIDEETGQITGKYSSPSGTAGEEFPLMGWVNESPKMEGKDNVPVIEFSVRWGKYRSITSWTGYCDEDNGKRTLVMQWHLVRPNSGNRWDHVLTGQDRFTPVR